MTDQQPRKSSGLTAAIARSATVLFLACGGYLVWHTLRAGMPDLEAFERLEADIPAITDMVMRMPLFAWAIIYVVISLVLVWIAIRSPVSRKTCFLTLVIAAAGLFLLYIGYFGLAVLPDLKLAAEQEMASHFAEAVTE